MVRLGVTAGALALAMSVPFDSQGIAHAAGVQFVGHNLAERPMHRSKRPNTLDCQVTYTIHTVSDLQCMQKDLAGNYKLANDIDASGYSFAPIGSSSSPFIGSLDGNGFKIANLSITSQAREVGLFGALRGLVEDLRVVNLSVTAAPNDNCYPKVIGDWNLDCVVGGLAGVASEWGTLNVFLQGSISVTAGPINNEGEIAVGGIFGEVALGGVEFSQANVTITGSLQGGSGGEIIGGLVGELYNGSISYSSASGSITAAELPGVSDGQLTAAGALGFGLCYSNSYYCTYADHSYSTTSVSASLNAQTPAIAAAAGFVAQSNGNLTTSFAGGPVTSTGNAGGFAVYNGASISNSYATGAVSALRNGDAGGFIPFAGGNGISDVYSTGRVQSQSGIAGGLVAECGQNGCPVSYGYWDIQTSGQTHSAAGVGLNTNDFKGQSIDGLNSGDWTRVNFPMRLENIDSRVIDYPRLWKLPFSVTTFPLANRAPYGSPGGLPAPASINTVFDHSMPWTAGGVLYRCDNNVTAATGAIGQRTSQIGCKEAAYANNQHTIFDLGGIHYAGGGNPYLLSYDGHPGIDFRTRDISPNGNVPVFASVSGMLFYPWEMIGLGGKSPYYAYCVWHTLGEVPDVATSYRVYFLHLLTHPAGIDSNGPSCNGLGTPGQPANIQSGWIDQGCIYKDENGNIIDPRQNGLPLAGGTHVDVPPGGHCVVAVSGDAGVPGAPHLHFEIQQIVPASAIPAGPFASYFWCHNEDDYEGPRDGRNLCIPADPYGWTGSGVDPWQSLTGIPSRQFWAE